MSVTFTVDTNDLRHILKQIQIAEEFTAPGTPGPAGHHRPVRRPAAVRVAGGGRQQQQLLPGQSSLARRTSRSPDSCRRSTPRKRLVRHEWPAPGGSVSNNDYSKPGTVIDTSIRTASNLISDMSPHNPAAIDAWRSNPIAQQAYADAHNGEAPPQGYVPTAAELAFIPNQSPDIGLSPPFNGWMTLFGQFFDHGLDLVTKGGNGSVIVPLMPDDPLIAGADGTFGTADDLPEAQRFMTLTRATPVPGQVPTASSARPTTPASP